MTAPTSDAYFIPLGQLPDETSSAGTAVTVERFQPTEHTRGPWGPFQHGSPPPALLTRCMEQGVPEGMRISRVATNLLGPVPYTELRTRTWVTRPGKQISMVESELLAEVKGVWRQVASGSAWLLSTIDTSAVERTFDSPIPGVGEAGDSPLSRWSSGYIDSIDARSIPGESPQVHWVRTDHPVVEGEVPTPWQSLMSVVDTANGIGATLDPREYSFMNTDLVVHLHRLPVSPWTGISAHGSIGPDGVGMTSASLHDEHGPIGRSLQTLLVQPQPKDSGFDPFRPGS